MRSSLFHAAIACAWLVIIAGCSNEGEEVVQPSATSSKKLDLKWRQLSPESPTVMQVVTSDPEGNLSALSQRGAFFSIENGAT